ncbi:MAG: aldehyde dehydrogenase family protein [Algicola sp.]|nr:aldehyde dehydrogenase family protein [Algicola sp.]
MMLMLVSYDPVNQAALGEVPITTAEKMSAVVKQAKNAQKAWAALSLIERQDKVTLAYENLAKVQEALDSC